MKKIVAIHQPNFFPWLGYFNKITRSDCFILLDDVQYPKTGGTWINRVSILVNNVPAWITVPIVRAYHGVKPINQIEINSETPWRDKILKTIQASYGRAPFFQEVFPSIQECFDFQTKWLCEFNLNTLNWLINLLDLSEKEIFLQSSLEIASKATENLIELTRAVNGTDYLCGGGAAGYQDDDKFQQAGLGVIYQNFTHPVYAQKGAREFSAGLSVLDALFHCGCEKTKKLVRGQM